MIFVDGLLFLGTQLETLKVIMKRDSCPEEYFTCTAAQNTTSDISHL